MQTHNQRDLSRWIETRRQAAAAIVGPDEARVEDFLRHAAGSSDLEQKLEGAMSGITYVVDLVEAMGRSLPAKIEAGEDFRQGMMAVVRNLRALVGPADVPAPTAHPSTCNVPDKEVFVGFSSGLSRHLQGAVPRPDAATWERLDPMRVAFASSGGLWVPWTAAATYVQFVERSSPTAGVTLGDVRRATQCALDIHTALGHPEIEALRGESVRVELTGPQLYVLTQWPLGIVARVRPWKGMTEFKAAWENLKRPPKCKRAATDVQPGDPYGGTLTLDAEVARWLLRILRRRGPSFGSDGNVSKNCEDRILVALRAVGAEVEK